METFALVTSGLAMAFLILGGLWWLDTRIFLNLVKERLVITLKNGEAFEGIMLGHDRKVIRLVEAKQLGREANVPVDGELYLIRSEVNYMQRTGGKQT
jgi:small nuclear ribonucleoprotein (snRNP)-like protein